MIIHVLLEKAHGLLYICIALTRHTTMSAMLNHSILNIEKRSLMLNYTRELHAATANVIRPFFLLFMA